MAGIDISVGKVFLPGAMKLSANAVISPGYAVNERTD